MFLQNVEAQLGFCTGNSGDPIFTENFGTGTTNNSLPAGTTTYNYSNGFPNDGFYTVSNGTFGNPYEWHQTGDHTPDDSNGKCLIVNASFSAGEFYRTTISGLCEFTTYEFSAWMINLVIAGSFCTTQPGGAIPINVRFEIWDSSDTNLLASGNTGNISETSTPNWEEYGLVFQTLVGQNTVILKMINNGIGGCGNDLAIDDIEFKSCGDATTVTDLFNNGNVNLCSSETPFGTTLIATPDDSVFSSHFYQWQESTDGIIWTDIPGETNQSLVISGVTTTSYYRTKVAEFAANLSNPDCITFSDIYELIINQLPNQPVLECWETATINSTTCSWEISGVQPEQPTDLECWETAIFNDITCQWDVIGTQPEEPTGLECWETATFNSTICDWEITGTQPEAPTTECWEIATFNDITCQWEVTGTQPEEPTGLECWESTTFNNSICDWEITGSQPEAPSTECWETATFNDITCQWDVTGTQPEEPTSLECWEIATFNDSICDWEISGDQPEEPMDLECWESVTFNNTSCAWEISGDQPVEFVEEFTQLCVGDSIELQANTDIPNSTFQWDSGETTEIISVNLPGTYVVESTDGCLSVVKTIVVEQFEIPIILSVETNGNDLIVILENTEDYFLFSIDGVNYQNSPIFYNLQGGKYTIYVKAFGCNDIVTLEHIHFFIPKFFTPNGDSFNDIFSLKGIEYFESSEVYIFDRYGKLLISAKNRDISWDGTYSNEALPSSDYWYLIKIEGKEFLGHFTLKR